LESQKQYDCVLTIVSRGFADQVVDAAREAGAHGGTVFFARGTGIHEIEKFFSISIQPEKELVLNVVDRNNAPAVMDAIVAAAGLGTEGRGLTFSLPIDDIVGIFCPCVIPDKE
jgi:nitrogen regulatory protein PII